MTTSLPSASKPSSRRALLAGAVGGLGVLAVGAIGKPAPTHAANSDPLLIGNANVGTTVTALTNNVTGDVFAAHSTSNDCINGYGGTGRGVYGASNSGSGVGGQSSTGVAVYAYCFATDQPAAFGFSRGESTGVMGYSGTLTPPTAKAKTGAYGYAGQDSSSRGVVGESPAGHGIHGKSTSGWAGFFAGRVYTGKYHEMKEISAPAAPSANRARLFLRDNGSGKTQLCVRFNTGAVQVLSTQP